MAVMLLASLAACSDGAEQAARASADAQGALAMGDLPAARAALLRAVSARDDVAENWAMLGQVQLRLDRYADAYYAYSRAVELDRGNAQALIVLCQIALLADRIDDAKQLAEQLETVQPGGDPIRTIKGYIALKEGRVNAALISADQVLAHAPSDTGALVLKARALEADGRPGPASDLLEHFVATQANDPAVLRNLLGIYKRSLNKAGTASTLARMSAAAPSDKALALDHARALFENGETARGAALTNKIVRSETSPGVFTESLRLWLRYRPIAESLEDARALPVPADRVRRMNLARFFVEAGAPANAVRLLSDAVDGRVTGGNADAAAVLAHAYAAQGRTAEAGRLFEQVLAFDATNIAALRGRTDLRLQTGALTAALSDAQRLVAENPQSGEDRLRLVRVYAAQGDRRSADRILRQAFDDVPANAPLYAALRRRLRQGGRVDEVARLDQAYRRQLREAARAEG